MGLLNLALGQLLGLFLPLAAFLVALYFYDRSRRRVVVSTLRFWPRRPAPPVRRRHSRIQHPLSLLLQLLAVLLLLLAIADPRPGSAGSAGRRIVLLLDTSAAMAGAGEDGNSLLDEAKALALSYLARTGGNDRVLLVAADGSPAVRVPFTADRQRLRESIRAAEPGWTALDLAAAFDLAAASLRLALDSPGAELGERAAVSEVVYVGPGRFAGRPARAGVLPALRFLTTGDVADSLGLLTLRARSRGAAPGSWTVDVVARNVRSAAATAKVEFYFDGKLLGHRELDLAPSADAALQFTLRTQRPGRLLARLPEADGYPQNDEAWVDIPALRRIPVQVVGGDRAALEPLVSSHPRVRARFVEAPEPSEETPIQVWARGGGATAARRAIVLAPPGTESPAREAGSVRSRPIAAWSATHAVAAGVRDPEMAPARARIFAAEEGDEVVAEMAEGPVILARSDGRSRWVAFGFDLAAEGVRSRLATPLLFANAVSWLDPGAFREESVEARPPGAVRIELPESSPSAIDVRSEAGEELPWVYGDGRLKFYAGERGTYRVLAEDFAATLALSQPEIATAVWEPPAEVARGLPPAFAAGAEPGPLWPWLALLGGAVLLLDWIRFGRGRPLEAAPASGPGGSGRS